LGGAGLSDEVAVDVVVTDCVLLGSMASTHPVLLLFLGLLLGVLGGVVIIFGEGEGALSGVGCSGEGLRGRHLIKCLIFAGGKVIISVCLQGVLVPWLNRVWISQAVGTLLFRMLKCES
jgi:hypothetical protein